MFLFAATKCQKRGTMDLSGYHFDHDAAHIFQIVAKERSSGFHVDGTQSTSTYWKCAVGDEF